MADKAGGPHLISSQIPWVPHISILRCGFAGVPGYPSSLRDKCPPIILGPHSCACAWVGMCHLDAHGTTTTTDRIA